MATPAGVRLPAAERRAQLLEVACRLFAEDGSISNPGTREFMTKYLAAFEQWITRNAAS